MSLLKSLPLDDAIRLRWALRDILARRFIITQLDPADLETLIRLGCVEMKTDMPVVTMAGMEEI